MTSLRIALRYLFARKSHQAVNIISRVAVIGVAVATLAIVCVLSVFNGFSHLAEARLSMLDPELKLVPATGSTFSHGEELATTLETLPEIGHALPTLEQHALATYGEYQMPVEIKGVPEGYERVTSIADILIDGSYLQAEGDYPCATLSVGVAIRLGARPGYVKPLGLYAPRRQGRINPAALMSAFVTDSLLVGGVYETDQAEYDADRIIIPLSTARHLLGYTNSEASSIDIALAPGVDLSQARKAILALPEAAKWQLLDRWQQQEASFKMISIEKWITFVMLAFILVIAAFNVVSTMSMLIIEKADDISTLRALGATPAMIGSIFTWEGWLITVTGGVAGLLLGVILCLAQQWGGFIRLNGDPSQLSISVYPVQVHLLDLALILALVIVVGYITGWIASRLASHH